MEPKGNPRWLQIKDVLLRALDEPAAEREAFVWRECGRDDSLAREVMSYLHENEGPQPPQPPEERDEPHRSFGFSPPILPGQQIGNYTIIRYLNEGGMGEVYLARQCGDVERLVAIKFLRLDAASQEAVLRFQQERQVLAKLNHPNIAKIHDAGTTNGRSYFVMEYIEGVAITRYCDQHRLDVSDRLRLFLRVLDGVQHCHQRGYIHRDIKPSNVLVATENGVAVPKLIDLGIAKAVGESSSFPSLDALSGSRPGTIAYMSPEQLRPDGREITVASDVYSLGIVLYELLAGNVPFHPRALKVAGDAEVCRIICEEDPPRPSELVKRLGGDDATSVTRSRKIDQVKLFTQLRKELDYIPLKAIEKEASRRYGSATALQSDIQNYLRGIPIDALPKKTIGYQVSKFAKRHKGWVAAATAIAAAVVFGIVSLIVGLGRARAAEHRANAARAESDQLFVTLKDLLQEADPHRGGTQAISLVDAMQNAAMRMEQGSEGELTPMVRATLHVTIADILVGLGMPKAAEPIAERALRSAREQPSANPHVLVDAMSQLGIVRKELDEPTKAMSVFREALELAERSLGPDDPLRAEAMRNVALMFAKDDDLGREHSSEAEVLCRDALEVYQRVGKVEDRAETMNNLAAILRKIGGLDETRRSACNAESITLQREAIRLLDRAPTKSKLTLQAALLMNNLGLFLLQNGEHAEAKQLAAKALKLRRQAFPDSGSVKVAESLDVLGQACFKLDELDAAVGHLTEVCKIYDAPANAGNPERAKARQKLGVVLTESLRLDEAVEQFEMALRWYQDPGNSNRDNHANDHANTLASYALCAIERREYEKAKALAVEARDLLPPGDSSVSNVVRGKVKRVLENPALLPGGS